MKVVLDTNVMISAMFWKGNEFGLLKHILEGKIVAYASMEILKELKLVLERKFQNKIGKEEIKNALLDWCLITRIVVPKEKITIIRDDPADNKVLECAIAAGAEFIITGDKHLLKLKKFRGISIITAKEFLQKL